jgi:hypothetical protein
LAILLPGDNASGQANQVQPATVTANLTATDFNAVANDLVTARQGILNNDSASAYNAINAAGSNLFALNQDAAGGSEKLSQELSKELAPVLNNIDRTRDALRDDNSTMAIRSLNNADLRLLSIMEHLPPGQEDAGTQTEE